MAVYGVAILSICMLVGTFVGDVFGKVIGVKANVGGVGVAMLMLVLIVDYLTKKGKLKKQSQEGIAFWSAMYIPIVIAMAAQQNVVVALKGGPVAILAGVAATIVCVALVPILSKMGQGKEENIISDLEKGQSA